MNKKNPSTLMTFALCTLLVLVVASPQNAVAQGAGALPSFIPFDINQWELPEGVAVDKVGNVYVSIGTSLIGPMPFRSDQIWKFSPSGEKTLFADLGPPGGGGLGLAVDAVGNVYIARGDTAAPYTGVYRVDQAGNIGLVPGTDQIVAPNALAFDQQGNLYITEMYSIDPATGGFAQGGIWRVPRGAAAELWVRDDLLSGLGTFWPYPVGANGIAFCHGNLYVINTEKVLVVQVPVRPDGSPGQPEKWAELHDVPESIFYQNPLFPLQIDGIAFDVRGNAYVTVPSRLAIVRLNAFDRSQDTFAVYPNVPLDTPLNGAFGTGNGERENLFVTAGGFGGFFAPGLPWPGPGLLKIDVGIPGVPLP